MTQLRANQWRLIPPIAASGARQMAIDRWLLTQHRQGHHLPTLRFYTWDPPAISLGYHQQRWPDRWRSLSWQGQPLDLVRRPSGGRAVLHQGDLTYGLVTSVGMGLSGGRSAIYAQLCRFLLRGWHRLGFELDYGAPNRDYGRTPNCFGTATPADLVLADGTKWIGSAQLWQGEAVLQHGSMPVGLSGELFEQVFGGTWGQSDLRDRAQGVAIDRAIETLTAAAMTVFGGEWVTQPLTAEEEMAIDADLSDFVV
ncbi:MAG: lipoate--protein ligase family protein [Prochlorothrix sp.]|nr:lipoate--protein ligase family protein [Prochlorothrix sp.]